jgi:hypothetical protein
VTQPRRLHVDEDLAANGRGNVHVLEIEPLTDCIKYKRLHVWAPTVAFDPAYRSKAAGRGTMGWRFAGFKLGRFSRIGLAFGFFLPPFIFPNLI